MKEILTSIILVLSITAGISQRLPVYVIKADTTQGLILVVGPDSTLYFYHKDSLNISGGAVSGLTTGGVTFGGSLGDLRQDAAKLYYDSTNATLIVGSNAANGERLSVVDGNLDIYDSGTGQIYLKLGNSQHYWEIGNALDEAFVISRNGTTPDPFTIDTAGNIGIYTASPDRTVSILGDLRVDDNYYDSGNVPGDSLDVLTSFGVGNGTHFKDITTFPGWGGHLNKVGNDLNYTAGDLTIGATSGGGLLNTYMNANGLQFEIKNDQSGQTTLEIRNSIQRWLIGLFGTAGTFSIYDNTTPGAHRISIDTAGNVGINELAPTQTLDVNGTARLRDKVYDYNNEAGEDHQIWGHKSGTAGALDHQDWEYYNSYIRVRNNTSSSQNWNQASLTDITDLGTQDYQEGIEGFTFGSSNVTVPVAGKYRVRGSFYLNATGDMQILVWICKNGTATGIPYAVHFSGSLRENTLVIDQVITCSASDVIDIRSQRNGIGGTVSIYGTNYAGYTVTLESRD